MCTCLLCSLAGEGVASTTFPSSLVIMASCRHYDAVFKKVITDAEDLGNCAAVRKYGVPENNVRRWRKEKGVLLACTATWKAFRGLRKREEMLGMNKGELDAPQREAEMARRRLEQKQKDMEECFGFNDEEDETILAMPAAPGVNGPSEEKVEDGTTTTYILMQENGDAV
ncbi:hypothetical protein HPB51_005239 [Rhipicephalus microplus]|uniref:Brinker DNA-binding domain-containing protein n=1 Tax=Rhipicephalus microplus TaxID=6941 RepID=A0A9J6D8T6_RHIMP|nr:hypothetical protein HPB51_005239 [Rhipicephalus microplus]